MGFIPCSCLRYCEDVNKWKYVTIDSKIGERIKITVVYVLSLNKRAFGLWNKSEVLNLVERALVWEWGQRQTVLGLNSQLYHLVCHQGRPTDYSMPYFLIVNIGNEVNLPQGMLWWFTGFILCKCLTWSLVHSDSPLHYCFSFQQVKYREPHFLQTLNEELRRGDFQVSFHFRSLVGVDVLAVVSGVVLQ